MSVPSFGFFSDEERTALAANGGGGDGGAVRLKTHAVSQVQPVDSLAQQTQTDSSSDAAKPAAAKPSTAKPSSWAKLFSGPQQPNTGASRKPGNAHNSSHGQANRGGVDSVSSETSSPLLSQVEAMEVISFLSRPSSFASSIFSQHKGPLYVPPAVVRQQAETFQSDPAVDTASIRPATRDKLEAIANSPRAQGRALAGIFNDGDTCFANGSLQLLLACPHFRAVVACLHQACGTLPDARSTLRITSLACELFEQFRIDLHTAAEGNTRSPSRPPSARPVSARSLLTAVQECNPSLRPTSKVSQQDAEEFLSYLLDKMNDEILQASRMWTETTDAETNFDEADDDGWQEIGKSHKAAKVRSAEVGTTAVKAPFLGSLRSTLHVHGSRPRISIEPFVCLQLDISAPGVTTLEDALRTTMSHEHLGDMASASAAKTTAKRSLQMEQLPVYLLLHVKRFMFTALGAEKLMKEISYPTRLVIPRDICSPALQRREQSAPIYELVSVVVHHGTKAQGGHYTCFVKHQQRWYDFDDTQVSVEVEPAVLSPSGEPYLFAYRRVA